MTPEFKAKVKARTDRTSRELDLWHRHKSGDPEAIGQLFQSLSPLLRRVSLNFRGNLPASYVEASVKKHALHAINTYDPSKGSQLNTHIMNRMNKVKRDVSQYQNPGRLAESSHWRVTNFQHVQANMANELGRQPTDHELAGALSTPDKPLDHREVARIRAGTRRDLAAVEGQNRWKPDEEYVQRTMLEDISYELDPLARGVLHMTFGMAGHNPAQARDIAGKLGLTPGRVSQIRREIARKVEQRYGHQSADA
jgi:DNA-directed RNA polymerase specialized sigma subunit